ncbi:MAG TPA: hypothetical protein VFV32_14150 [Acidimicrobiales bacterium]|nr:hypothetical protein [Acidimicrobiales bacterium]
MTDQPNDTRAKSPVEAAVEAFVYAPIGLLFEGSTILPQLVEKGRNQVTLARMIGQFALRQAGDQAAKAAGKLQDQAAGVLDFIGGSVSPTTFEPAPPPPRPAAAPAKAASRPASARKRPGAARDAARKVAAGAAAPAARPPAPEPEAAPVATLAIPDYDGLSASHVVNRLAGLTPAELDAVRSYELANRGRKTILSKVAQLQSS